MTEAEFVEQAEATLARIEAALEASGLELDVERKEGGIIDIEFADRSRMVINRHGAAREIWIAARSGGFHFRWQDGDWRDTRDGTELFAALSRLISAQGGEAVILRP
jgi:CyaY protein